MRTCVLLLAALGILACNHGVAGNSGFGDGGEGEGGAPGSATEGADSADTDSNTNGDEGASASLGTSADGGATEVTGASLESGDASLSADGTTDESVGVTGDATESGSGSTGTGTGTGTSTDTEGDADTLEVGSDACGFPLDGPWLEIEYTQAGIPATSPHWEFSATPGWGEAQWAAQGESWPEVWDIYQNIEVENDPVGIVATVGSSGRWQLMLGFQDLSAYDHATVCVEGRSVSVSASVQFDVYNPWNDCGGTTTMAHDWNMHAEGVDLGQCFVPGGGVQAVRIETSGGSGAIGIKRVRVVLHGAVY